MMIEIDSPEAEVIIHALKCSYAADTSAAAPQRPAGRKSLAQLFADSPFKGLDIDFERELDYAMSDAIVFPDAGLQREVGALSTA